PPNLSNALTASSAVETTSPRGMAAPATCNSSLAWYSWIFILFSRWGGVVDKTYRTYRTYKSYLPPHPLAVRPCTMLFGEHWTAGRIWPKVAPALRMSQARHPWPPPSAVTDKVRQATRLRKLRRVAPRGQSRQRRQEVGWNIQTSFIGPTPNRYPVIGSFSHWARAALARCGSARPQAACTRP